MSSPHARVRVPPFMVGLVAIIASISALLFIVRTINWTETAGPPQILSANRATSLWFSSEGIAITLETAGDARYLLRKTDLSTGLSIGIDSIDFSNPKAASDPEPHLGVTIPRFTISRDGQRIAWIAKDLLCASSTERFNNARCEQSIDLPLSQTVRELSFFGSSSTLVGVVFDSGRFRTFDLQQGEMNRVRPGSQFSGPWRLRSAGIGISALPEPRTGDFGCIEIKNGKIYSYTPPLAPLIVTAVSFSDCTNIVVGTGDGLIIPLSRLRVPGPGNKTYASLDGAVRSLAMNSSGKIYAAGDFPGIIQMGQSIAPHKVSDGSGIQVADANGDYLLYVATLPMATKMKLDWQPTSWSNFYVSVSVAIGGLFMFLYALAVAGKASQR